MTFKDILSFGRAGVARIATAVGAEGVTGNDPYADVSSQSRSGQAVQKGKVFSRWTYPFRGYSMPILEIPSNRVQRYLLAFEYFTSDPLCNSACRIRTEFALGGMTFDVMIEEDEWPKWTPADWKEEYNKLIADEKKKRVPPPSLMDPGAALKVNLRVQSNDPNVKAPPLADTSDPSNTSTAATGGVIQGIGTPNPHNTPGQGQPQITDVGKKKDPSQWQPGQDIAPKKSAGVAGVASPTAPAATAPIPGAPKPVPGIPMQPVPPMPGNPIDPNATPATEVTPIHQFIANKIKLELEALSKKLDVQAWLIKFAQDAMTYGDAFANIVDAFEGTGVDGEDQVIQGLVADNKNIDEIRKRYAQAYEKAGPKKDYSFGQRVSEAVGVMINGTSASIHVGPELLKAKKEREELGLANAIEDWHLTGNGGKIYEEFMATARKVSAKVQGKNYTVAELQSLNPSAVWVTRNDVGEVILVELVKRIGVDASPLNIDDIIHWKWQGPDWQTYGISEFYPAFRNIKLKRSLEEALAANAERYANPIIQMKVGSDKVNKLQIATQSMLDDAANLVKDYDRRSILVTPWHHNIEIHGMDGKPLRIDFPLQYANNQIMAVLGIPETFLWGGGSNFASVRAQFQTMVFRMHQMQKDAARIVTTRIFNRYLERRGWLTSNDKLPEIKVKFAQHELDSDQSIIGLVNAFANLAKSIGSTELPVSYTTILEKLGHNYEQEMYRKGREKALMRKMQEGQPGQAINQTPQKTAPYASPTRFTQLPDAVAEDLANLSWTRPRPDQQRQQTSGTRRRRQ